MLFDILKNLFITECLNHLFLNLFACSYVKVSIFSLKPLYLDDVYGVQEFKKGSCATCHTHGQGGHYLVEEVAPSDSKATSVAHYQRRSYCRERASEKGLALT